MFEFLSLSDADLNKIVDNAYQQARELHSNDKNLPLLKKLFINR